MRLPQLALQAMKAHWEKAQASKVTSLLVFHDGNGHYLRRSNLQRRSFLPLLARAKLDRIRLHDLRHTAATLMLRAGVQLKVVSETLGHASIALTGDLYGHVLPSMQDEAASRMDALFRGPK